MRRKDGNTVTVDKPKHWNISTGLPKETKLSRYRSTE